MLEKRQSRTGKKKQEKKTKKVSKRSNPDPYLENTEELEDVPEEIIDEQTVETENMTDGEVNLEDETSKTSDIVFDYDIDTRIINEDFPKGPSSGRTVFILVKTSDRIEVVKNVVSKKYNLDFVDNAYKFLSTYLSGFYDFEIENVDKFDLTGIAPSNIIFGTNKKSINRNYLLYGFLKLWNDEYISLNFLTPYRGRAKNEEYAFMKLRLALGSDEKLKEELKKLAKNSGKIEYNIGFEYLLERIEQENKKLYHYIHSYKPEDFLKYLKKSRRFEKLFNKLLEV